MSAPLGQVSYLTPITSHNQFACLYKWASPRPPLLSLTPALLLTLQWGRHRLCIYSLEVIVSHFLFTADTGQYGAVAAQLIIAHAGPTEGMALWNTSLSAQPPVTIAFHYTGRLCIRSQSGCFVKSQTAEVSGGYVSLDLVHNVVSNCVDKWLS